jgi:hypothetical protein
MATRMETIVAELEAVLRELEGLRGGLADRKVRRLVEHSYEHVQGAYSVLHALSELEELALPAPHQAHAR